MSEDIKKEIELTDEDLEGVAGGYTSEEITISFTKAMKDYSCPIQAYNDFARQQKGGK